MPIIGAIRSLTNLHVYNFQTEIPEQFRDRYKVQNEWRKTFVTTTQPLTDSHAFVWNIYTKFEGSGYSISCFDFNPMKSFFCFFLPVLQFQSGGSCSLMGLLISYNLVEWVYFVWRNCSAVRLVPVPDWIGKIFPFLWFTWNEGLLRDW